MATANAGNNAHNQLQAYIDPNRVIAAGGGQFGTPAKAPKAKAAAKPAASPTATPGGFATVSVAPGKAAAPAKPTSAQTQAAQGFFTGLNATIDQQNGTSVPSVPNGPVVDSEEPALTSGAAPLGQAAQHLAESAEGVANKVGGWAENLPTPGGIALLVVILLGFLWAVVPVNGGKTRAQLLYYVLMEKSILKPPDGSVGGVGVFPFTLLSDVQGAGQYNTGGGGGAGTTSTSGAVGGGGGNYTAPPVQNVSINPNVPYVPDFSQF